MELESLTWNYPTPTNHNTTTNNSQHLHYHDDDTDDDDDDSYYVELAPYDMTERLKEVNRALVEDPTPAESDRTITVRFREVIADYQSPREFYPSDSDDGYGDSSDLIYDAEEDEGDDGLTTLPQELLGGNLGTINLVSTPTRDSEDSQQEDKTIDTQKSEVITNWSSDNENEKDVPKLQLDQTENENAKNAPDLISSYPNEKSMLKVDETGLADLESFMKEIESSGVHESIPEEFYSLEAEVTKEGETISLVEVSEKTEVERGPKSLNDLDEDLLETNDQHEGGTDDLVDASDVTNVQVPAKSESDFLSMEYSDDFEEFPDDEETNKEEKDEQKEKTKPNSIPQSSPVQKKAEKTQEVKNVARSSSRTQSRSPSPLKGHRSRRDQQDSIRKAGGSSGDRGKRRGESNSPSEPPKPLIPTSNTRIKNKRPSAAPPTIKPALLTPGKMVNIKSNGEQSRHRSRATSGSLTSSASSSTSSSPSSSASSSSSRTVNKSKTTISGPIRPTAHSGGSKVYGSPVKSLATAPSQVSTNATGVSQSGRLIPPVRVRKAASASDLHNRVSDESEDRRKMNDEVFHAWLKRKDKQAAATKRQQKSSGSGGRGKNTAEVAERRARAEEAFQAWLARKREQLRLEKRMRGERRRLEDQNRYARSKAECDSAYREWCRRKREEVRSTSRGGGGVPRSQSLERPWVQEKTRNLYSAYLNAH